MSLNILVIPEDFRKDQFVLAPIVRRIFAEIGKPNARVQVCIDPLLGGISQALDWTRIQGVIRMYPMVQVFLLLVDRDGNETRHLVIKNLERLAGVELQAGRVLFGENAWQEIEVWALACQELPSDWRWQEIRAEVHPKERFFEPIARNRGLVDEPGEGRTTMGREAAQNYGRVRSRCAEDIVALETRLRDWLETG